MALHVRRATGLSLAFLAIFLLARPAYGIAAEFEIPPEGFAARLLNAAGEPEQRSGAHPDRLEIDFSLNLGETSARDLVFNLPPGLGMNATAVSGCSRALVEAGQECPAESQVGTLGIALSGGSESKLPLFELESAPGQPISIGTKPSFALPLKTELRPSDFGITVKVDELPRGSFSEGHLVLWGIPADHQEGTSIERRSLISAPSTCGPLTFGFETRSWEEGAPWLSASTETAPLSGCESLDFEPRVGVRLSNPVADSPTGLQLELSMPEEAALSERAQAQISDASIELPAGIGLSPGGAAALAACSDAQLGLGNDTEAHCPPSSRVGSVEMASPAINGALHGTIYLGQERPGQRARVFVVVDVAGSVLKFVGVLGSESTDGRLAAVLQDLPPLSINRLALSFDGGPAALLASPLSCGSVETDARFSPYGGGPTVKASASSEIAPVPPATVCAAPPFSPQLTTAASTREAGRPSSFTATVRRRQGEQLPRRLSVTLPAGLAARLGAVQACTEDAVAAKACPASSRLGSLFAAVGSGTSTVGLQGGVFLTGPYRRSPFGLSIEIPAAVGPFDLGTIALRGAAEVNPRNGRLSVVTDPIPASIEGVPIRFQTIELSMDRAGLIRNPTGCSRTATDASMEAQSGAIAALHDPFSARGCGRLGFKPALQMALIGASQLHKGGKPALRVAVRLRRGDTNLRSLRFSLPSALGLSTGSLHAICSRRQAIAGRCPSDSQIGRATARSALLSKPLSGSIYVAQPQGEGLPDIWTHVSGAGIEVNLRGKVRNKGGKSAIELAGLPDIPLDSLEMSLAGGPHGLVSLVARPCVEGRRRQLATDIAARGQNGASRVLHPPIAMKAHCSRGLR